jgi:hypothetical protein
MRDPKSQRIDLYKKSDGLCFYCEVKTVLPVGIEPHPANNLATIDHVFSRCDPRRFDPLYEPHRRHVLSCYRCNQTRSRFDTIAKNLTEFASVLRRGIRFKQDNIYNKRK